MEKNIEYPLDYGRHESVEKWSNFCSTNCCYFVDCPKKGGFCSSTKQRRIQPRQKSNNDLQIKESSVIYSGATNLYSSYNSGGDQNRLPLFWHFPEGRGTLQPWRRKLWERNK